MGWATVLGAQAEPSTIEVERGIASAVRACLDEKHGRKAFDL